MTDLSRNAVVDAVTYFDSWLAFRQRYSRVPGVQAAVLLGDELLLSTAHGHADIDAGAALTPQHLFRIASHSKTFTGTAIFQLAERGALRLDDTARHWLPFLAETPLGAVTIRELLGHGAGVIRDGFDSNFWQLYRQFPDEEGLQKVALDRACVIPANERFKYSNIGYSLLGLVIAAASGQSYHGYVQQHIVDRLGLADLGPEYDAARSAEYATGYSGLAYSDQRVPIDHVDTAAMAAATGFYSTAADLVRYAAAHFHGDTRLLSDASKRLMQRAEWKVDGTSDGYGLGMARSEIGDRLVFGHGGGYPGHATRTFFDPADQLAVSVLTNAIDGPPQLLASGLIRLVDLAAKSSADDGASGTDLQRFTGRYANLWGVIDVVQLGGQLYRLAPTADDPTHEPFTLEVVNEHTLRMTGGIGFGAYGETLQYEFADGSVASIQGGGGMSWYPIEQVTEAASSRERVSIGMPLR